MPDYPDDNARARRLYSKIDRLGAEPVEVELPAPKTWREALEAARCPDTRRRLARFYGQVDRPNGAK